MNMTVPQLTWLPMDTAPIDGSAFIGIVASGLVYKIRANDYYEKFPHEDGGPTYKKLWEYEDYDSVCPCQPKGWLPMPNKQDQP